MTEEELLKLQELECFKKAFEKAIGHEGGYVNDPLDAGGETKYGISKRSYPNEDIKNLTLERARGIYYVDWWHRYALHEIEDCDVAVKFFDTIINTGFKNGSTILQNALLACGEKVAVDGWAGVKTYAAVNSLPAAVVLAAFRAEQANYYKNIVRRKPSQERFINGWLKRAYA